MQAAKVWTSCHPYAKSKLKIPHFTGVISVWTNWQGWQSVVQTFDLDEDDDIAKIRALLDESEAQEEPKQ